MILTQIDPGPERNALLPLLLLADDSETQVYSYMQKGVLFVALGDAEVLLGAVLAIPIDTRLIELKSVAIAPDRHNQGLGKQMLELVFEELRNRGYHRIVLGTGNSSIGQIAFYQKTGFRMQSVEPDFFTPENGYPEPVFENGIQLRDMVWFEKHL